MRHQIITLGREFGSGGREIGQKLAAALDLPFYDHQLISMAAKQAELPEAVFAGKEERHANPWLFRGIYEGGPRVKRGQSAEDILFQMQSEVIRRLGRQEDCIIVGRCADYVLRQEDVNVVSLFLCAPFSWRVRHRMEREGLEEKAAQELVRRMDKQRQRYYNHYTGGAWGMPENYDLCINSARLGIDRTAALLAVHWKELRRGSP